ncbi:KN motif and ankyrin repeat domain-containing protein 2 [Adelges cooleyi]|uniref:KN motif and ankyrin repeat domain-containing protein 2 n=1 Tax=Adelges cooleyi TaxID=133065 RepID=UPI0021807FCC|nr:KN motif and ankyrin repeat domain-containing protein 2 [Adelges cooleyi]
MYSARNRNAVFAEDTFQIHDWLRSDPRVCGGGGGAGPADFDHHLYHRVRPVSPVKRYHQRIFGINVTGSGAGVGGGGGGPDRRRQLKSMESLLGLSDENLDNQGSEVVTRASPDVQDSLDRALMDFEETLALAFQSNTIVPPPKGFSNHNLAEGLDECSTGNRLDSSIESSYTTGSSSGYSTKPDQPTSTVASTPRSFNTYNELQLVREQMMESLEIIRDLEEQVKLVPMLKAQVATLSTDKQRLSDELDRHKWYADEEKRKNKSAERESTECQTDKRRATKDVAVSCVPICRDVGVTTPRPTAVDTHSSSTMTDPVETTPSIEPLSPPPAATAITASAYVQTVEVKKPTTVDASTQSARTAARTVSVGVTAKPRTYDAGVSVRPVVKHFGCTAAIKTAVDDCGGALQVDDAKPPHPTAVVVRPVARTTQTDASPPKVYTVGRTTQTDSRPTRVPCSRTTQTDPGPQRSPVTSTTQTDPGPQRVPIGRATQTDPAVRRVTKMATTQTDQPNAQRVAPSIGRRSNSFHHYTPVRNTSDHPMARSEGTVTISASKIPRLKSTSAATTPEPNRKVYSRQDTYTKSAPEVVQQPDTVTVVRPIMEPIPSSPPDVQNESSPESDMAFKPIRDDLCKDGPSKEMRAALKVLNDSLKKTSATLLPRAQLKHAIDIVREEWFKASSMNICGGQVVKNYVDSFKSYSPVLLEFIINMTDAAGNTVLHYAISHGNFEVVSAVLDTGMCNVNLTNDAGYSSIMLVSLAEVKNSDEMKIIRKLFKSGDVNLQAKKHGQTTLMLAVSHGKTEVVKLLLECGADINVQDEDGSTALMCAAEHGLQEVVNILLACPECDVSIADNDGSTALSIAMEAGHREIGIGLYAKQHLVSRENSPFHLSKSKRSRSANTVMMTTSPSSSSPSSYLSLKKSPGLQPRQYATLTNLVKTRSP